jgi:tRNA uracil 4-sulfurtransferase
MPKYRARGEQHPMARGVMLMSGGIDSPVALHYLLRQGHEMVAVHLDNRPFTDDSPYEKIVDHLAILRARYDQPVPLYVLPHGPTQVTLMRETDRHVGCVLCRRFMWRSAERIAEREGATFLATGEALGQVASQTLSNMRSATVSVKLPIVRPLIGFDKQEIERVAKEIGTYAISTRPGVCCQAVPPRPATRSNLVQILAQEERIDVEQMIDDCVRHAVVR